MLKGSGFEGTTMFGSQHNDYFNLDGTTKTNFSGGIQGGISNGMDIYFYLEALYIKVRALYRLILDVFL